MKKTKFYILTIVICILLSACQYEPGPEQKLRQYSISGDEEYAQDYDIIDKGPVRGGVLNLFSTVPDTFNPLLTKNTYVSDFLSLVYEGLTRLDEKHRAQPLLSDYWTVSADGLIWNFHIRDNVQWQDGQPFTAADVEYTVQLLMTPGYDSVYKPLIQNIATCTAVDSSNFKLVLSKPNYFLPEMMTFPILPKHLSDQATVVSQPDDYKPVGTGPYRFESYSPGKKVSLSANIGWWRFFAGNESGNGMFIDKINVNVFSSSDDAMGALQTGNVDVVSIVSSDIPKYGGRSDLTIKKYTSREFEMLAFNTNSPVMSDKYVRRAISLAIDRNQLISEVMHGNAQAAEIPVLPESWIYDFDNIKPDEVNSGNMLYNSDSGINSNSGIYTDPALTAKTPAEVLRMSGWKENVQGFYKVIDGVRRYLKVELLVNSNNKQRVLAAQNVCKQLTQAGIPAVCTQIGWDELVSRINVARFDIAFIGLRIPQIPDLSFLYSEDYLPVSLPVVFGKAFNVSGYRNMQLDSYLRGVFSNSNADNVKLFFKAALEQINTDVPYVGLYFTLDAMVYDRNVRGALNPYVWNKYYDIMKWYITRQP